VINIAAKTLKQPATLTGVGLHSGLKTTVRICPATASGIVFVRTDLPGRPRVSVQQIDHKAAPFRTVIKNGPAEVHTVEHLLSALAGTGVTDCEIEIDGLEVPGMDGSALEFFNAIEQAGTQDYSSSVKPVVVTEAVTLEEGIAKITALPHNGFSISYTLHYPGNTLAQGTHEFDLCKDSYAKEIAPARTFAIKKDAEQMRAAGLGKGANLQNTVVIDGDCAIDTALRFNNEPVRHKILDLIGDLYVLGRPVQARFVASCSGHKINREMAMKLVEKFG
jgi:UDP-3-O-acyl N-acetylglucosamine deacetylase